ncbi:MAG: hypothetical protein AB7N71_01980 [Phycisphaerae bacterium]
MSDPLGYLITFSIFGTRLHGDERGSVDRQHNVYGEPTLGIDHKRNERAKDRMGSAEVRLTNDQQCAVEDAMKEIAARGGWELSAISAADDHVHVVLSGEAQPQKIRALAKRWLSDFLNARWRQDAPSGWWAEGGSCKYLWDADSLRRAVEYVAQQRCRVIRGEE